MGKRFVSICFRHLATDWFTLRQPALRNLPFVLTQPSHGRMIITAANAMAQAHGIFHGMVLADARAINPSLQVYDDKPALRDQLLHRFAEWCIRFTPVAAIDPPDGIMLDVSGCSHLWGGEESYLSAISRRLKEHGYLVSAAMADTIGAAWAIARFGKVPMIIQPNDHLQALLPLPPESLRLEPEILPLFYKLGLVRIYDFISMPRHALLTRFGRPMLERLNQALGLKEETIQPVQPPEPWQERLPCLEPIVTATGIEIGLRRLIENICHRLKKENKGLRHAIFKGYRMDGKTMQLEISTNRPSCNVDHLLNLFVIKLPSVEPGPGIELFVLEAARVEDHLPLQEKFWKKTGGLDDMDLAELLDRITSRIGNQSIRRYLPDEHYWPERSIRKASSLNEEATIHWNRDKPRPLLLLSKPEPVLVTAPIPDYPPMLFRYKDKLHKIIRADGPERIEQEWWIQEGEHRDYYRVEDDEGRRYWLFRSGHYETGRASQWFIHGFFA
jgi:protein ImuB